MVPIGTVARLKAENVPYRVPRYDLFPAAEVMGVAAPGVATGTALHRMEELAHEVLPPGIGFEWTELAFQQQLPGTSSLLVFGAAALFVFLVLAAQYESWNLPLAVVMIVPMCLLASVTGLLIRGMPIDVLAQIGFVVLVGLAAKNAILIVEFARQTEESGVSPGEAAVTAARTRLRPILMTSLAFIFGVFPAGGCDRRRLGDAAIAGHGGVRGHARRHRLRPVVHAGLLHGGAQDQRQEAEGERERYFAQRYYSAKKPAAERRSRCRGLKIVPPTLSRRSCAVGIAIGGRI